MKEQIKNLKDIAQLYEELKTINENLTEENKNYSRNIINLEEENRNLLTDLEYIKSDNGQVKLKFYTKRNFLSLHDRIISDIFFN